MVVEAVDVAVTVVKVEMSVSVVELTSVVERVWVSVVEAVEMVVEVYVVERVMVVDVKGVTVVMEGTVLRHEQAREDLGAPEQEEA